MNAILSTTTPLPVIPDQPAIAGLGRRQVPLGRDQVATPARQPCENPQLAVEPPSIGERTGRLETAALRVDDRDRTSATEAAATARLAIDYARGSDGLIPDDGIVLDTAWPRLAGELQGDRDFCRAREQQSAQRGNATVGFTREDWERLRGEAHALATHQRAVREHSYLPPPAAMFRIH